MTGYEKLSRAELNEELKRLSAALQKISGGGETERLNHELHAQQVELETQNRELHEILHVLEEARDHYTDLYEFAPVGYATFDAAGVICDINLTGAALLGCDRTQLTGKPLTMWLSQKSIPAFFRHMQRALAVQEKVVDELMIGRDSGDLRYVSVESVAVPSADGVSQLCRTALIDITERKQVEAELIRAKEEAEQANHAKSQFLSRMSHELRTPLNAILGFAQLLDGDPLQPLTPMQSDNIRQILRGGWHLLGLIDEVLDLARIESGKMQLYIEPVAITTLVKECIDLMVPLAQEYHIEIADFISMCDVPRVSADRMRLNQVLLNLISNAIKFNREAGKITLRCEQREDGRLRILVQDTGIGIAADKRVSLFQPFNRLSADKAGIGGSGIGLSVSKGLIELMGGEIGVESIEGQGSAFWIELPVADGAGAITGTPAQGAVDAQARFTILYIEDNPAGIKLMKNILLVHRPECGLISSPSAELGLDLARTIMPDVILMDINLPGMTGMEALARLKGNGTTRNVPVIAVSAYATAHDIEVGMVAGFQDYITKPVNVGRLLQALDAVLAG